VPELGGFEMMRCIRAINRMVRTIYASGCVNDFHDKLEMEERRTGAKFLYKPFTIQELTRITSSSRAAESRIAV
jgi:hypothetical protein